MLIRIKEEYPDEIDLDEKIDIKTLILPSTQEDTTTIDLPLSHFNLEDVEKPKKVEISQEKRARIRKELSNNGVILCKKGTCRLGFLSIQVRIQST